MPGFKPRLSPPLKQRGVILLSQNLVPESNTRPSWHQMLNQVKRRIQQPLARSLGKKSHIIGRDSENKGSLQNLNMFLPHFLLKGIVQSQKIEIQDSAQLELRAESLVPLIAYSKWMGTVLLRITKLHFIYVFSMGSKVNSCQKVCPLSVRHLWSNACEWSHLMFITNQLWGRDYCNCYFADVKTEAKKVK